MNKAKCLLLAVAAAAMAFTLSCSSDFLSGGDSSSSDGGGSSSSDGDSSSSDGGSSSSVVDGGGSSSSDGGESSSSDGGSSSSDGNSVSYQGKNYEIVKIGEQVWFAENLNYDVPGSKCYNDYSANCEIYGRLYDWATAQIVCPAGWRLPSNDDWDELFLYVDEQNDGEGRNYPPYDSETAGKYLKAVSGWNSNGNGTDKYGFSGLPGGAGKDGHYESVGDGGGWWSDSEYDSDDAYYRIMIYLDEHAYWKSEDKSFLLSVRCVSGGGSSSSDGGSSSSDGNSVSYQGKNYETVTIDEQVWFAENLNYDVPGSKCYDDDPANCEIYGRLYDWATAMDIDTNYNSISWNGSDASHQGICPSGWHIPSNADWDKLFRYADGTSGAESPYDSETAGKYLKATSGWSENGNGTDAHGFSALPGGLSFSYGSFHNVGDNGFWWSASAEASGNAYIRYMGYNNENAFWRSFDKSGLFSVRCVKN